MTDIGIWKWEGGLRLYEPEAAFFFFRIPTSKFFPMPFALLPMPYLLVTRNPILFFVHFFQIHSTVCQIRPLVNIVYPDIPDDAFLINKNERSFGNPIGT